MIKSIEGQTTQDIYDGVSSKASRKLNPSLHQRASDLLDSINAMANPLDLRMPPSNRLHKLSGHLKGYWSVSINDQFRIIFKWINGHAEKVEIIDYHK